MNFDWAGFATGMGNVGLGIANTIRNYRNDKANREIAEANFALAGQQFDWEKNKQMEAWNREDNAVQRRVADLKAAGINPLMAAGGAAQATAPAPVNAPQHARRDITGSSQAMLALQQEIREARQLEMLKAQIDNTKAEREAIKANTEKVKVEAAAIADRNRRDEALHEFNMVTSRLDADFANATYTERVEKFKLELQRANLTNIGIGLDNVLRQNNIDVTALDKGLKEVELRIQQAYGMSEKQAEIASKWIAQDILLVELGQKRRDDAIWQQINLPTNITISARDALIRVAGHQMRSRREARNNERDEVWNERYENFLRSE